MTTLHHYSQMPYAASASNLHRTATTQTAQTTQTIQTAHTEISLSSDVQYLDSADVKLVLNFTPKEIQLVRRTWKEMISDDLSKEVSTSHASIASSLFCIQFYSNLLAMEPELEKMFPSIKHQAVSFSGVLATAIVNLETLNVLDDYLNNLGKRHARILGIDPPHFELMGVAFLKTFHDRFGSNFTLELERCWARLYTYLANSILQFGIDPVLKIDKLNSDLYALERSSSHHTTNSLFDARSISTASTQTLVTSPAPMVPKAPLQQQQQQKQQVVRSPVVQSTLTQAKKVASESKMSKRISSRAEKIAARDDKECVIM